MGIRILLADDHEVVRKGLCALLRQQPDFDVIAEAGDGRTAVDLAVHLRPHVVIMDVSMPDLNGIEATRQILKEAPKTRVVALSMHTARGFVCEMLRAGAAGYLVKSAAPEELVRAVHAVHGGETYLSPKIAAAAVGRQVRDSAPAGPAGYSGLTAREREVLQLVAEGWSSKQIAQHLDISLRTVDAHRRNIFGRLGLSSVAELTKFAIREGLTPLDE